jgi:hypothetical protein
VIEFECCHHGLSYFQVVMGIDQTIFRGTMPQCQRFVAIRAAKERKNACKMPPGAHRPR